MDGPVQPPLTFFHVFHKAQGYKSTMIKQTLFEYVYLEQYTSYQHETVICISFDLHLIAMRDLHVLDNITTCKELNMFPWSMHVLLITNGIYDCITKNKCDLWMYY